MTVGTGVESDMVILGPRPRPGMEGGHEARPRLTIGEGSVMR